jgi:Tol biopolymer transport system component
MPLASGTRLGPYEIIAPLGAGGMGEVYRARDSKLKREVAIKVLPADVATDRERLARFQREAEVLASLNHPHIAQVYGFEENPSTGSGQVALVMELVEGEDLSQRIARGAIPIDEALPIAKQIAEALEAAHDAGIVHRDLKPANVKVRPDSTVKVLDFGLAKPQPQDLRTSGPQDLAHSPTITSPAMTMHGVILGTAAYMSPEQAKGKAVDKRADIWAFGCVLYEMLSGKRAFQGDDVTDIITSVMRDTPDWNALPGSTPASIQRLLRRCLEKEPRRRAGHMSIARLEIDDAMVSTSEPVQLSQAKPARGGAGAAFTIAAVAIAAAVGLFVTRPAESLPPAVVQFSVSPMGETPRFLRGPGSYAISPDSQLLVYSSQTADGPVELWLHSFRDGNARRLANTVSALFPFWSADSRAIAFFANGKLNRLDLASGGVETICNCPAGIGTWNRDDVILFSSPSGINRVPAGGGTPETVTSVDLTAGEVRHMRPQFLPDGRRFLYGALNGEAGKSTLRLRDLESGDTRSIGAIGLGAEYVAPGYLVYAASDGPLLARPFDADTATFTGEAVVISKTVRQQTLGLASFSTSPGGMLVYDPTNVSGEMELAWFNRDGRRAELFAAVSGVHAMALASNDQLAAVEMLAGGRAAGIWLLDAARGTRTRFTFDADTGLAQGHPTWSPDLRQIVFFIGNPGSQTTMLLKDAAGTANAQPLLPAETSTNPQQPTDWSPDGRMVIFEENTKANSWDLRYARLDDRRAVDILHSPFAERQGQVSPDGKYLAYVSTESGQQEVYVVSFPNPTERWTISSRGGTSPRWGRDGRELLFVDRQDMLMRVPIPAGDSFRPGVPAPLFPLGGVPTDGWNYAIGRDGRLLILRPTRREAREALNVVLNLPQLLRPPVAR